MLEIRTGELKLKKTTEKTTLSPSLAQEMTERMRFHISSLLDIQEILKNTVSADLPEEDAQKLQELYIDDLGRHICRLGFLIQDFERCLDGKGTVLEITRDGNVNGPLIDGDSA